MHKVVSSKPHHGMDELGRSSFSQVLWVLCYRQWCYCRVFDLKVSNRMHVWCMLLGAEKYSCLTEFSWDNARTVIPESTVYSEYTLYTFYNNAQIKGLFLFHQITTPSQACYYSANVIGGVNKPLPEVYRKTQGFWIYPHKYRIRRKTYVTTQTGGIDQSINRIYK